MNRKTHFKTDTGSACMLRRVTNVTTDVEKVDCMMCRWTNIFKEAYNKFQENR